MKLKLLSTLIALVSIVSISTAAPKGGEALTAKPAPAKEEAPAVVKSGNTILASHAKAIGTIGKTGRYTVVKLAARSLTDPNLTALVLYDEQTDSIIPLGTASGVGIGHTILSAGSPVAAAALIRPPTTRVSNNSYSDSEADSGSVAVAKGGNSASVSSAKNDNTSVNTAIQGQQQGQVQGQQQGQVQGQAQGQIQAPAQQPAPNCPPPNRGHHNR